MHKITRNELVYIHFFHFLVDMLYKKNFSSQLNLVHFANCTTGLLAVYCLQNLSNEPWKLNISLAIPDCSTWNQNILTRPVQAEKEKDYVSQWYFCWGWKTPQRNEMCILRRADCWLWFYQNQHKPPNKRIRSHWMLKNAPISRNILHTGRKQVTTIR